MNCIIYHFNIITTIKTTKINIINIIGIPKIEDVNTLDVEVDVEVDVCVDVDVNETIGDVNWQIPRLLFQFPPAFIQSLIRTLVVFVAVDVDVIVEV